MPFVVFALVMVSVLPPKIRLCKLLVPFKEAIETPDVAPEISNTAVEPVCFTPLELAIDPPPVNFKVPKLMVVLPV